MAELINIFEAPAIRRYRVQFQLKGMSGFFYSEWMEDEDVAIKCYEKVSKKLKDAHDIDITCSETFYTHMIVNHKE